MTDKIVKVDNFPSYLINYCEYGSKNDLSTEDLQNYEKWLEENNYAYYSCDIDSINAYDDNVAFGLPCETVTAFFIDKDGYTTLELLEIMQKEYKDREPIAFTFRRDKHTNQVVMVYQANHSYDSTVKVCFTVEESHGSICKNYYRQDTTPASYEEYKDTLRVYLNNYPADNYKIVKRINWCK